MRKFTHIDAFYQVARYVESVNADADCPEHHKVRTPVTYRGTVKLHGSNAGVACSSEALVAQSRSRELSVADDNYGFAAFVAEPSVTNAIRQIELGIRTAHRVADDALVVLFGEWIGPGLQSGVALSRLATKQWVLFAVKVFSGEEEEYVDAVPSLADGFADIGIFSVADAPQYQLTVDFADPTSKERALEFATRATEEVEACCPWGKRFGIEGPGEGLVWVPMGAHWGNSSLFFKTKGDKHKVTKSRSAKPQLAPEVLHSVQAFVEFAVTENRLRQGVEALKEMGHALDMRSMGHFLKWVGQDVKRECALELESNALEWKHVTQGVTEEARRFFALYIQQLALG